jgi:hypothetical protein
MLPWQVLVGQNASGGVLELRCVMACWRSNQRRGCARTQQGTDGRFTNSNQSEHPAINVSGTHQTIRISRLRSLGLMRNDACRFPRGLGDQKSRNGRMAGFI